MDIVKVLGGKVEVISTYTMWWKSMGMPYKLGENVYRAS